MIQITLSEEEVCALLCSWKGVKIKLDYKVVEDIITGADAEDGGADHTYVIKHIPTGKFYKGYYTDWDIENTEYNVKKQVFSRCDLETTFVEVKPVEVTVIRYVEV